MEHKLEITHIKEGMKEFKEAVIDLYDKVNGVSDKVNYIDGYLKELEGHVMDKVESVKVFVKDILQNHMLKIEIEEKEREKQAKKNKEIKKYFWIEKLWLKILLTILGIFFGFVLKGCA